MKFLIAAVFLFSISVSAKTPISTEVLALRLWNVMEKAQNTSYAALDSYRIKLSADDQIKKNLSNPSEFKRIQTILRNIFVDRVSKEFSRKEILNLTQIYKRPEMSKMRIFEIDFWDEKTLNETIVLHMLPK